MNNPSLTKTLKDKKLIFFQTLYVVRVNTDDFNMEFEIFMKNLLPFYIYKVLKR